MRIYTKPFREVLEKRSSLLVELQEKNRALREKAFSFDDISDAQKKYTTAVFNRADDKTIQELYKNYTNTLKKHGFDIKDITGAKYICDKCEDTGLYKGKLCSCMYKDYLAQLKQDSGMFDSSFTFDTFNPEKIKDSAAKQALEKAYHQMKVFVEKYPNVNKNTILISGQTGTGKTCLAQAVANAMLRKGYLIKYINSFSFSNEMLKIHLSPVEQRETLLDDYLKPELLIIDDLGTEPISKNVTLEYLLEILIKRQDANHPTLITTNLDGKGIIDRYQERFFSRLTNKAFSLIYSFSYKDLRR